MTAAKHSYSKRKYIPVKLSYTHTSYKCDQFFSFQTPPVSVHGLVALCTLGCVTSNLTLVQAALMEIDKILGR